jgi:hypothetical protein
MLEHRYKVYREHLGRMKAGIESGSGQDPLGWLEVRRKASPGKPSMCHGYAGMHYGAWSDGLDVMLSDGSVLVLKGWFHKEHCREVTVGKTTKTGGGEKSSNQFTVHSSR